jgi:hypothetical protein
VNVFVAVIVPPAFVTDTVPVIAPKGTVTRMYFAVKTADMSRRDRQGEGQCQVAG